MAIKKKSCVEQIRSIVKNITVEPAGFLILFASYYASLASQTLNLDKTCRVNLNLSEDVCDAVRYQNTLNNTENEKLVQTYVADLLMWKSLLQTILPCLLYPFVGGWLDLTGRRKLFMIIPVFGELFQNISNIVNIIFFYQTPVEAVMFFDVFFTSITGGSSVMFLAMYSYIADVTTEKNRTHRLGFVGFCVTIGMPVGSALSGIVLKQFGYYAIYSTSVIIHILNLWYLIFYLSEPPRSPEKMKHDGRGFCYGLKTFFNPNHLKNTFRVFLKKTEDNRFIRLVAIMLAVCVTLGPVYGEGSILYLSARYRFNWDEVQYSVFQTYTLITNSVGAIITLVFMAKLLQWHDSVLGLIACTSKIAGAFVFCFAATGAMFYLGPAMEMFSYQSILALRSMLSKQVDLDELGKVNSVLGLFENLLPFAYVAMYTRSYAASMDILPGGAFLLGACFALPAGVVFLWFFVRHRKGLDKPKEDNLNKQDIISFKDSKTVHD